MSEVILNGLLGLLPSLVIAWWFLRPTKNRKETSDD